MTFITDHQFPTREKVLSPTTFSSRVLSFNSDHGKEKGFLGATKLANFTFLWTWLLHFTLCNALSSVMQLKVLKKMQVAAHGSQVQVC